MNCIHSPSRRMRGAESRQHAAERARTPCGGDRSASARFDMSARGAAAAAGDSDATGDDPTISQRAFEPLRVPARWGSRYAAWPWLGVRFWRGCSALGVQRLSECGVAPRARIAAGARRASSVRARARARPHSVNRNRQRSRLSLLSPTRLVSSRSHTSKKWLPRLLTFSSSELARLDSDRPSACSSS